MHGSKNLVSENFDGMYHRTIHMHMYGGIKDNFRTLKK